MTCCKPRACLRTSSSDRLRAKALAASRRERTRFMIAAFRSKLLSKRLPFAHIPICELPRLMILVAGAEKGRLRREVMRFNLKRRFFFPSQGPPSTSQRGLRRLKGRCESHEGGVNLSKENLTCGPALKVKAKVLAAERSFQECIILTAAAFVLLIIVKR